MRLSVVCELCYNPQQLDRIQIHFLFVYSAKRQLSTSMSGAAASGTGSVVGKGAIKTKSGSTAVVTEEKGFEPEAHFYPR